MDYFLLHKKLLHKLFTAESKFDLHIPFHGFQHELIKELELKSVVIYLKHQRTVITEPLSARPIWSQDWWPNCVLLNCESTSENKNEKSAVEFLKKQTCLGVYHQTEINKTADRIHKKIKNIALKRIK